MAQGATPADVGSFVRDPSGTAIGSLHAILGNQAVMHLGFFNTPSKHPVIVPPSELADNGGRLVLDDVRAAAVAPRLVTTG